MKTYLVVYCGALLLSVFFTPCVLFVAKALNIYDDMNIRKVHARAIPRLGGVAIVLAMLGLVIPVLMLNNYIGEVFRGVQTEIIVLLSAGMFIFLVGLIDDLCHLRVRTKLSAQIAAAIAVCAFGIRIEYIALADWYTLDFGWFSWPLTILWIIGITNALNLIDGLDGLAAGISAIACAVIAVFAIYTGQPIMAVLMLALLGSLTGFLFYNFNPARIFMGDCGSLFLGFILATSSVLSATKSATFVGLALPALALGVPIFDTLFSILRRFLERRSIFSPDRGHIHHQLLERGLKQKHVVILIYLLTLVTTGLGMFMMATRNWATLIIFGCGLLLLLLAFRLFGAVRLRETINNLNRKRLSDIRAKEHQRDFDKARLYFYQVDTFDCWWLAMQNAAEQMECVWMSLYLQTRDGAKRTILWRRPGADVPDNKLLEITMPLRQRRAQDSLRISFSVRVNGSLEAAGHRAALLSRLIDEHSLRELDLPFTETTPTESLEQHLRIIEKPLQEKPYSEREYVNV